MTERSSTTSDQHAWFRDAACEGAFPGGDSSLIETPDKVQDARLIFKIQTSTGPGIRSPGRTYWHRLLASPDLTSTIPRSEGLFKALSSMNMGVDAFPSMPFRISTSAMDDVREPA